ncbi:MAG: FAD-dependent oxidoreductase [Eubacteriales bacterium]|nr:FAD-dependent oxidoreductase [Eubacteriales bacterium]
MKILVIGGVAGGMSAAARLRRLDEQAEIIVFERGDYVSFSNCCLPYHLSETVPEAQNLVLMTPEVLNARHKLDVRVKEEVISIDRAAKKVRVKKLASGEEYEEDYDKLVLSPGAKALDFPIPGSDTVPSSFLRTVNDAAYIHDFIKEKNLKNILVLGGGFIGIEAAENLKLAGYEVTIVEALDQVLGQYDEDMIQIIHKELYDQGVKLYLGRRLERFEHGKAILSDGTQLACDFLVKAAGVRPESSLARDAGLSLTEKGAIAVDQNYVTSDPDIYALGDAIEVYNALSKQKFNLALAGPAQKQARYVADHIMGKAHINHGFIGSSCIKVFDYNAAATGLSSRELERLGRKDYDYAYVIPKDSVGLMPDSENQYVKVIFEVPSGKLLGCQAIGKGDVVKRVDVVAALLKFGATVEDLMDLELCYAPPFSIARDSLNFAGYVATNLLHGTYRHVHVSDVRPLVEQGAFIVDVREPDEFKAGHLVNAVNIPLSQIRERMDEIPKDQPVYLHCRSGQRSYNAIMALQQYGFNNLYNIAGSFLGISCHEYFQDQVSGRKPIVTVYSFN